MTAHMLIAPDTPAVDRGWYGYDSHTMRFPEYADGTHMLTGVEAIRAAPKWRLLVPGWRIPLTFWIDSRLGSPPTLPPGYALAGWIVGEQPEHESVCQVCYGRPAWFTEATCIGCIGEPLPGDLQG